MRGGTPAILALERAGIPFAVHEFTHDGSTRGFGSAAANALGVDPDRVFKTLLADATSLVVGVVPVTAQLSMKALAAAVGAKRAEMCTPAVAERSTGYVVGGISPFGQRHQLATVVDETCALHDTVFVSGGRRGLDIELAPADLVAVLGALVADIAVWPPVSRG